MENSELKNKIYEDLRNRGQRITSQKKTILDVLLNNRDRMLSVTDIKNLISDDFPIDDATIYRNTQAFSECGLLETMVDESGLNRYKVCDTSPHHHMICQECGKIINFPCTLEFWKPFVEQQGFRETRHIVEVYGICRECSEKQGEK